MYGSLKHRGVRVEASRPKGLGLRVELRNLYKNKTMHKDIIDSRLKSILTRTTMLLSFFVEYFTRGHYPG